MPRAPFPSGRKSLLLLALTAAIVGGAWWQRPPPAASQRPPPEPADEGRRLSDYIRDWKVTFHDPRPLPERLGRFGPAGVAWLAYELEHGRSNPRQARVARLAAELERRDATRRKLPLDFVPDWLHRWFPQTGSGGPSSLRDDERVMAARLLNLLGPRAAPAIPALTRSLASDDHELAETAAAALHAIGPASWPAINSILERGDPKARIALLRTMFIRLQAHDREYQDRVLLPYASCYLGRTLPTPADVSDAEVAAVVAVLDKTMYDPNADVRAAAELAFQSCRAQRKSDSRFDRH